MVEEDMKKSSSSKCLASSHSGPLACAHLYSGMKHTAQNRETVATITFYGTLKRECVLRRGTKSFQGPFTWLSKMQKLKERNIASLKEVTAWL